jgi:hypothetical protein
MMPTLAETSALVAPAPQSLSYLLLPLAVTVVSIAAAWAVTHFWGRPIDLWLAGSQRRRLFFSTVFAAVEIVGIGVSLHAADFNLIVQGDITWHRAIVVSVACFLTVVFFTSQIILHLHDEESNDRMAAAEARRVEAAERHRQEILQKEAALNALDSELFFAIACGKVFLERIDKLKDRIVSVVGPGGNGKPIGTTGLQRAFAPHQMVKELVMIAYHVFREQMIEAHGKGRDSLRVTLFRMDPTGKRLQLVFSWNGRTSDCVRSPVESPDRFAITESESCMAAASAWRSELLIEPDAVAAHGTKLSPFHYFGPSQHETIASIVTMPMPMNIERPASYVLSVDTDRKHFFTEEQRPRYRTLAENLGRRLHLANSIERLFQNLSPPESKK